MSRAEAPWLSRRLTCVGAIAGGFGVQGEVRLKSFCAEPAAIAGYAPLLTEDGRSFGVRLIRPIPGAFAARLTGVATREEAEALKGTRLYAPRDRLPPLREDEFYHADLIGLAVVDPGGAPLGTVRAVLDHGAATSSRSRGRGGPTCCCPSPAPRCRPSTSPGPHRRRPARGVPSTRLRRGRTTRQASSWLHATGGPEKAPGAFARVNLSQGIPSGGAGRVLRSRSGARSG